MNLIRWLASRYMSFVLDMQDVTRYLFLHGHILQQQSPDSMRAFPGFPPWTKSWSARSKTSQTDCGVHCVLPLCCHSPPWTPKETLEFPAPIYDQSPWSTHVTGHSATHHTQSFCPSHPLPEFTGIGLLSSPEQCDSYLRSTPLPCNLPRKSALRPDFDS